MKPAYDSTTVRRSLRALPKAEVHVHLEGCFEAATLERWAREAGVPMPRPREQLFTFDNLADVLELLDCRVALRARGIVWPRLPMGSVGD